MAREVGTEVTYRIVGEDEADPSSGRIAWTAPVARALLGSEPGEFRELPTGRVEVLSIETAPEQLVQGATAPRPHEAPAAAPARASALIDGCRPASSSRCQCHAVPGARSASVPSASCSRQNAVHSWPSSAVPSSMARPARVTPSTPSRPNGTSSPP